MKLIISKTRAIPLLLLGVVYPRSHATLPTGSGNNPFVHLKVINP
jgi:hypothetical protein